METKRWVKHYDAGVQPDLEFPRGCLYDLFAEAAARRPEKTAVVFLGAEYSYGTLHNWTDAFASAMSEMGVKKGDRIILSLPNCPQFIAAFYGLLKLGAVCVMLNPLSTEREIDFKFRDSGARGIIALDQFYDKFYVIGKKNDLDIYVFTRISDVHPVLKQTDALKRHDDVLDMQDMLHHDRPDLPPADVKQDDLAVVIYSGGTTGDPKGVMESHRNVIYNTWILGSWFTITADDRGLAVLPFFHGFGMQTMVTMAMLHGASLVVMPQFDIEDVFKNIQFYRATFFAHAPTMYVAMNNFPENKRYDLSSLRVCISGGAPLSLSVKREFERLTDGSLVEGYGLTESTSAVCCTPRGLNKEGSVGIPMPNTEIRIVDLDNGAVELGVGEIGEIVVKSPTVMMGYWNNPKETKNTIREGWLYSGDIGKMDEDGYLYLVDRKKEMIIAGGFNIYPKEVEETILTHPAVMETAVIGVPDSYRGETVKAFIVVRPGMELSEEEIGRFCKENLLRYMVPRMFEFRESLPKSQVGKIMKKELKEEHLKKEVAVHEG